MATYKDFRAFNELISGIVPESLLPPSQLSKRNMKQIYIYQSKFLENTDMENRVSRGILKLATQIEVAEKVTKPDVLGG